MVEQNNVQQQQHQQHKQLLSFNALPPVSIASFAPNPVVNANSSLQHHHLQIAQQKHAVTSGTISQGDAVNQLSTHGVVHLVSGVVTPALAPTNHVVSTGFVNSSTALVVAAAPQGGIASPVAAAVGMPILASSSPSRQQLVQGSVNHGGTIGGNVVNNAVVSVNAPFGRIFASGFPPGGQRLKTPNAAIVANYNNAVLTLQQQQRSNVTAIPSLSVGGGGATCRTGSSHSFLIPFLRGFQARGPVVDRRPLLGDQ